MDDWELVISDDGPNDGSVEYLQTQDRLSTDGDIGTQLRKPGCPQPRKLRGPQYWAFLTCCVKQTGPPTNADQWDQPAGFHHPLSFDDTVSLKQLPSVSRHKRSLVSLAAPQRGGWRHI